jgi:ABC-2 type transport system permease protein
MTAVASTITTERPPTALRVFVANVRAEWTKLRSVRSTVWTLVATIGIAVGFGALVGVSQMSSCDNLDPGERLRFDPTFFSLSALWLAQLAVGVLGVLLATSEYATGQIRATLGATPQRVTVLAAKAATFTGMILATGALASFSAFWTGQGIFASKGLDVSISEPGVLRAVVGGALYLAAVGLLGIGLGAILRRTAGASASAHDWFFWTQSPHCGRPRLRASARDSLPSAARGGAD